MKAKPTIQPKSCSDETCNLKVFCKRYKGKGEPYPFKHGENEDGIHYCVHIINKYK